MTPNRKDPARGPAPGIGSCDCDRCRAACLNSPGWFLPGQIAPLARHLGLSVDETFAKYLAVGVTQLPDGSRRHGLMPHKFRDGKKPGSVWTLAELAQPGRCVFFDRGKCSIYPVRPDECARMMHDRADLTVRIRLGIVARWTDAALAPFAKLLGRPLSGAASRGGRR
ncbi:MAG TPA: YkgJ family cysteine cluster protein [Candidatus Krumholzibacteria bacterium]|nr:YkgJ family cysteine cluster protein [Candidatus Krumholzibacteria bacterium]